VRASSEPKRRPQVGVFQQQVEKLTPQQQMLADPSAMTNMMYNNLSNIVPQARCPSRPPAPGLSRADGDHGLG